jgi:hypothetical protein
MTFAPRFLRVCVAACLATLVACSGSDDGGASSGGDSGAPSDGAHDDSSASDTSVGDAPGDVATDSFTPGDSSPVDVADTTPPTDTASSKALVRIFDGDDGAAIYVCQAGARIGGDFDRISPGGRIDSGYFEVASGGSHKVHAQSTTAVSCISDSSGDPSYFASAGSVSTLFVKGITGFTGIVQVTDDLTPPASGQSRVRVYDGAPTLTSAHTALDVCVAGGGPWASGLSGSGAAAYVDQTPGSVTVEVREAATGACGGPLVGSFSVTVVADATHTLFLVDGKGSGSSNHASFCTDANAGVAVTSPSCTDVAF